GWALGGFGDSANVAAQAERALQIRQAVLGPAHSDTLEAVGMLAHGKYEMGRESEARKLLQDAMAVTRGLPDGLSVGGARVVYTYGDFLLYGGHGPEALPYFTEALAGLKR